LILQDHFSSGSGILPNRASGKAGSRSPENFSVERGSLERNSPYVSLINTQNIWKND